MCVCVCVYRICFFFCVSRTNGYICVCYINHIWIVPADENILHQKWGTRQRKWNKKNIMMKRWIRNHEKLNKFKYSTEFFFCANFLFFLWCFPCAKYCGMVRLCLVLLKLNISFHRIGNIKFVKRAQSANFACVFFCICHLFSPTHKVTLHSHSRI